LSVQRGSSVPRALSCRASSHAAPHATTPRPRERTRLRPRADKSGLALLAPRGAGLFCTPKRPLGSALGIHKNTTRFHSQITHSAACPLWLPPPPRSLQPHTGRRWSGALQLPSTTAQCNHDTFIYQSEMRLQEMAPKTPCKCFHLRPCIHPAKAQASARSNVLWSGFIFVAASCLSILP